MILLSMKQDYPENFISKQNWASKVIKQILTFPKQTQAKTVILTSQNFYERGPFQTKFELREWCIDIDYLIVSILSIKNRYRTSMDY